MFLNNISLRNFKNYEDSFYAFAPQGSLIVGKNGIGKTNLLEAISYFTYGKSILNHLDNQLINYSKNNFFIKSEFCINDATTECKAYYDKQKKKVIHIDDKPLKKISDLYHLLQVVYSGPEDIYNIFSTPAKRRQFIDMAIAKVFPVYIDFLRRFRDALIQRNSLMKTDFNQKEKEAWDKTFCEEAKNIVEYRIKFCDLYKDVLKTAHTMIVKNEDIDYSLKLNVFYESDFCSKMTSLLKDNEQKERKYQTSLFGPHLDDFVITLNQKNAMHYASQGQKRSIVIALKIALAYIISSTSNVQPILIFDDTLAELDKSRSTNLLSHLSMKHQIFIASPTSDKYLSTKLPILNL